LERLVAFYPILADLRYCLGVTPPTRLMAMGELALIRESGVRRDLGQGEVTVWLQGQLRPFDAARGDVLVR
jgi:hypothetical protein